MSTKPGWIYPQWYKARRELVDELKLTSSQTATLTRWFEKHIFEFGQDYSFRENPTGAIDYSKEAERHCVLKLAESIHQHGMFLKQVTKNPGWPDDTNIRMTLLVCGCPAHVERT